MATITKTQCKDITEILKSMLLTIKGWTPKAKEGFMTTEEIVGLQDDAQEIINILDCVKK